MKKIITRAPNLVNPVNKRSSIRIALPVSSIGIQYSGSSGTRHPATETE
jgi:hypothetical protein